MKLQPLLSEHKLLLHLFSIGPKMFSIRTETVERLRSGQIMAPHMAKRNETP